MRSMRLTMLLNDSSMHFCTRQKNSLNTLRASSAVYASSARNTPTLTSSNKKDTKGLGMEVGSMWWS